MRQADLAGAGNAPSADQPDCGRGVAHGAERTFRHERLRGVYLTGYGVYLGGLDALGEGYLREYRGDTLCKHGFTRPWRSQHEQIVRACRRDLYRRLRLGLPHNVRKIQQVSAFAPLRDILLLRRKPGSVPQELHYLGDVLHAVDLDTVGDGRLLGVSLREEYALCAVLRGGQHHRERSVDRRELAVKGQLPDENAVGQVGGDESAQLHQRGYYRQVEHGAYLAHARRGEVHRDLPVKQFQLQMTQHRADARLALLHGDIRHSYDIERRLTRRDARLNRHHERVQTEKSRAFYLTEHSYSLTSDRQKSAQSCLYHGISRA